MPELIDREKLKATISRMVELPNAARVQVLAAVSREKKVDAVEVPDKKLLKAINLLIKQYEHSKNSEYVHHPVAHAFFHTWKQLDERISDHERKAD